jgi:hypothetical protein
MKKSISLFLMSMAVIFAFTVHAQNTTYQYSIDPPTIGSTGGNPAFGPFCFGGYNYAQHNQILYPASQLTGLPDGAMITKLIFPMLDNWGTADYTVPGATATIKLIQSSAANLGSSTGSWQPVGQTVYTGAVVKSNHQLSFTLTSAFEYKHSNPRGLLIDVTVSGVTGNNANQRYKANHSIGANHIHYSYSSTNLLAPILPSLIIEYTMPYTITFNANGGTGSMPAQTFLGGIAQNLTPNAFTFPNCAFMGWATTANGTVEYGNAASYTATGDDTLYAVWSNPSSTSQYSIDPPTIGTTGGNPAFGPFCFSGYNYTQHNQILYPASQLTGLPDGAMITKLTFPMLEDWGTANYTVPGAIATIKLIQSSAEHLGSSAGNWQPAGVTVYTGPVEKINHLLSFPLNSAFEYKYSDPRALLIDVTVTGVTDNNASQRYKANHSIGTNQIHYSYSSTNLFAQILPSLVIEYATQTYTVTFDANGGSGTMPSQTFTRDDIQKLNANTFTLTDYFLVGWSTTPNGGVEYANEASFVAVGNIILYAVWRWRNGVGCIQF